MLVTAQNLAEVRILKRSASSDSKDRERTIGPQVRRLYSCADAGRASCGKGGRGHLAGLGTLGGFLSDSLNF